MFHLLILHMLVTFPPAIVHGHHHPCHEVLVNPAMRYAICLVTRH